MPRDLISLLFVLNPGNPYVTRGNFLRPVYHVNQNALIGNIIKKAPEGKSLLLFDTFTLPGFTICMKLIISEMFTSLQGETTRAGYVSAFIRLSGCNLRCTYCDTAYAQTGGDPFDLEDIVGYVKNAGTIDHVTLTGGEPLFQSGVSELAGRLISEGYRVRIETNGSYDIAVVPPPAERIVDVKTPSSGHSGSFNMKNLSQLNENDEIKFVVSDHTDLIFAKDFYDVNLRTTESVINVSPAADGISYAECAGFIIREMPRARMSLQLHKIIWPAGEPK